MNPNSIKKHVLNYVNDDMEVVEYGHGHLVYLPLRYVDDDAVALFVEETEGGGYRVTDHGETALRLAMTDLNLDTSPAQHAWKTAVGPMLAYDIGAVKGHVSMWVPDEEQLGRSLFAVAEACNRVEQLRLLARGGRVNSYAERITRRLETSFPEFEKIGAELKPRAQVDLSSGRTRQVTAAIFRAENRTSEPLIIQAMGGNNAQTREEHLDRTYHLFDLANTPKESRIAVARGNGELWGKAMISEVSQVGRVVFEDDAGDLERLLRSALSQPQAV